MHLQNDSEIVQLILTSSIENKMRLLIISSLVVLVNHSTHELKVFSFAADVGDKLDGIKRNEVATKKFTRIIKCDGKQGQPIPVFADLNVAKGKRKIHTIFSSHIAIGCKAEEASFPIRIQPLMRKCVNVPTDLGNVPLSVSIIKHNEQFFVTIFDDPSPFMSIKNDTDFNLFVAQTDMTNPNAKYILPHKEGSDDRFSWFQMVPSKQRIFYTPPTINEHFPEITNPDYGLIFACVSGDDFIRWSQPIKIDGTKKTIISVPMFGDVKLNVDVREKMAKITIGYIQLEKDDLAVKSNCDLPRDFYRTTAQPSFLDINSHYQKSFSLMRRNTAKAFNVNIYSQGVSLTVYKDGDRRRTDLISLNVDDIGVQYSKLACKLKMSFGKVQVDNERFTSGEYDFPVVLCNKDMPKMLMHPIERTSIWDLKDILEDQNNFEMFSVEVDLYETGGIEHVIVKLQPIRLYIEDTFINVVLEMVDDCLPINLIQKSNQDVERVKLVDGMVLVPNAVVDQALYLSEPFRLRSIRLEPLHILLSVHTCMRCDLKFTFQVFLSNILNLF